MKEIRIAIVGVGNCASALLQGLHYYHSASEAQIPGVMYADIGGYRISDITVSAAFDVDRRKVGKAVKEAIFAPPNCCRVFSPGISSDASSRFDAKVMMGPVMDGVSEFMASPREDDPNWFDVSDDKPVDIVRVLKESKTDILINYLPVGSQEATEFYAQSALDAGVAFLNCIPVFIASDQMWEQKFIDAGLPLIGDDMRSQLGASVLSQMFQELLFDRGCVVDLHAQINMGFNTDFANMEVKNRLASKKISKENVIRAQNDIRGIPTHTGQLFAGPAAYIPRGEDEKVAFFDIRAKGFGDFPIKIDGRLSVQDSENSAGVVVDAIRYLQVARELGIVGALRGPSAFTQKTPPQQMMFADARSECEALAKRRLTPITKKQVLKS